MRPKFRAWSFTKKMYDRVLAGPGDPCSIVWDEEREEWLNFDNACGVIMQFTGLLDKNGCEIYEGDILDNSSGRAAWVVRWGELSDGENLTSCVGLILPSDLEEWHVKGNIHEHPELAKHY